ncbi:MAG: thiamine pyrophosphate-dependent dehydrogenase E1 component subunit alpha [Actinomycetota bacterium]|nr:thiamine pyrophosphate-dependent dehydrogenase E1 component subunit alpha [Actinomycetota bacterium]
MTETDAAAAEDIRIDLAGLPADELVEWLQTMLLIRRFEERAERLGSRGAIPGGIHSAAGQEAVAVGTMRALHPGDPVAGTHRSHHTALAKGLSAPSVMAELYGRATGAVGGRGGTMHLADLERGYLGGNGIVGAGVGIAMGAALACQLQGEGVAVGFVGDGGLNVGRTWEAANLAVIWDLPLVIVCENNMYAVETRFDLVLGGGSAVRRAEGFGLDAVSVDGQDVAAVYRAVHAAAERARSGGGASFVEARTYRYEGHNTGQIITYRSDDEVADWRQRDPINRFSAALAEAGVIGEGDVAELDRRAGEQIDAAVAFAESSPFPDLATAPANVTSLPTETWESE